MLNREIDAHSWLIRDRDDMIA